MATTKRKLDLSDIQDVLGAVQPDLCRLDNKIMTIGGHPCEIFHVQTVTTAETDCNLTSKLAIVRGGVVKNMTTGVTLANKIVPLSTNGTVAVVKGNLPADNDYIVVVYGTEILK